MNRGILTTIYANLAKPLDPGALRAMFETAYGKEPFVRLMPPGEAPNVRNVRGSNFCDVNVFSDRRTNRVVVVTAIDNLVKGAAGQAVQNMNVMLGIDEREGLWHAGTFP
jgi:N-acetyl-gamma-glutamyl-phosphate reductase